MDRPGTLVHLYFDALDRYRGRSAALRYKAAGRWQPISYQTLTERVEALAAGLLAQGLVPGDRVAILSENRPEWAIADFACLTSGLVDVPIYPTLSANQIGYLLTDSAARAVFVSSEAQLAKIEAIKSELPLLRSIIGFDRAAQRTPAMSLDELANLGNQSSFDRAAWLDRARSTKPADLATVIYTSGTTGTPKGVMLTHGNIASNVAAALAVLPVSPSDECLSLLPLSHIFERMAGHYTMFQAGVVINYAESIETVPSDIREVRPSVVAAVPRLYEKIYSKAMHVTTHASPIVKRIFLWGKATGERWADRKLAKAPIPISLLLAKTVADLVVFGRFRRALGGRLRFFVSGGAPLSEEVARFFYAAGIPILEGYGLTETSPIITVNTPTALKLGTVGRAVPGVEMKIAPDGEILARGPNIMAGYLNKEAETREAVNAEGWFHTGDIGEIDSEGFLKITDRKKDLIATAGGKKIAPQPIENSIRQNPYIANAVMLGDRRKFAIALLVPNFDRLEPWARKAGLTFGSREELVGLAEVQAFLEAEVKKHFRDLARFEVPKKFVILSRDFSIERGELTPKLSIKRKVVEDHNREAIEALYQESEE